MTAPALVMVAAGSTDPRVGQVTLALRHGLQQLRPELDVHACFLRESSPSGPQVLDRLTRKAGREVVLVPLELTHAVEADPQVHVLAQYGRSHPSRRISVSRPVGPEVHLLNILDLRLRSALAAARVLELDGLVLSSGSAGDVRGAALLARRARQWSTHHRLPCLTAAADGTGPSVAQAIQGLRAQGRRHIAVGSFFLSPDELYMAQADQALRCGAVAVSEPIGAAREVFDLVLARYAFAAMDLLDFGAEQGAPGADQGAYGEDSIAYEAEVCASA